MSPRKPRTNHFNGFYAAKSVKFNFLSKFSSNITFLICGSTNIPCLNLVSQIFGNLPIKFTKPSPLFPRLSQSSSSAPTLWLVEEKQLFRMHQGSVLNIMFSGNKIFSGWPVLHNIMFIGFSSVLHAQKNKAGILPTTRLQSE